MTGSKSVNGLSMVVVGASGDLARRKIYPALFALYCQGLLPESFQVFGFARSEFTETEFRERVMRHLTCRYTPEASCAERMDEFLARCHYFSGGYGAADSWLDLYGMMREREADRRANRIFYLAIPPGIFLDVVTAIGDAGLVDCGSKEPWTRVVVEKPFGRDRESSDALTAAMARVFPERETFRIDHYLGKEVIQNLLVLRFANLVFQPIWNHEFIRQIQIVWKEDLSLEGRGGYFDQYGIIRDVLQNHLLQILALVAMDPPQQLDAECIAREKARVLRAVRPVQLEDLVIGQYTEATVDGRRFPSYVDEETVADDSRTATYAAARLTVQSPRWKGVPFLVSAGKGLDSRMTEIRIQFREIPDNMFCGLGDCPEPNELVIRVQPDESVGLSLTNKVPGMGLRVAPTWLDLQYRAKFKQQIPDAYESLLLEVVRGDKSLFIRDDELQAAWDVFSPVLQAIDEREIIPESYAFGSSGPAAASDLLV
jgi:glucose-6-phosphate 1-dehydrogenase